MKRSHPHALAFRRNFGAGLAEQGGAFKAWAEDDAMAIEITALPVAAFNPAILAGADGGPHPLFTRMGETLWCLIHDQARRVVQADGCFPANLAFVFLRPAAIEAAAFEKARAA